MNDLISRKSLIEAMKKAEAHGLALGDEQSVMAAAAIAGMREYIVQCAPAVQKWIPVTERLPDEHDSLFARLYGTEKWDPVMFRTVSDNVLACVEYEDGERAVKAVTTKDGEWHLVNMLKKAKVTHWMPLPELPKEG